jgi:hypothetical protein
MQLSRWNKYGFIDGGSFAKTNVGWRKTDSRRRTIGELAVNEDPILEEDNNNG